MVAVVKRNSSYAFTVDELRGKRSCHPGFGSPAGWDIPVGALVQRGFIRPKDCDVLTGTTLRGDTDVQTLRWGWLGSGARSEGRGVPSQQNPTEGSPGEISSSSWTSPLLLGSWGNILGGTRDSQGCLGFCGGCHGAPTHLLTRVDLAPVGMGSGVRDGLWAWLCHRPVLGLSPSPSSPWASGGPCWKVASHLYKC